MITFASVSPVAFFKCINNLSVQEDKCFLLLIKYKNNKISQPICLEMFHSFQQDSTTTLVKTLKKKSNLNNNLETKIQRNIWL